MHDQGLLLAANLHDDVGIGAWEDKHAAVAKIMGETNASATIPFTTCGNKTYAYAVEDIVLKRPSKLHEIWTNPIRPLQDGSRKDVYPASRFLRSE